MAGIAVTAPAFTVLDLPGGERNLIGLARVSTDAQDALTGAGCGRIYAEKISTRKTATERPGLAAALGYLRRGDTLAVWKLDRLGRSVKEVLTVADDLHAHGIGVKILTGKLSGSYSPHRRRQVLLHDDGRLRRTGAGHHPRTDHGGAGRSARPGPQGRPANRDG